MWQLANDSELQEALIDPSGNWQKKLQENFFLFLKTFLSKSKHWMETCLFQHHFKLECVKTNAFVLIWVRHLQFLLYLAIRKQHIYHIFIYVSAFWIIIRNEELHASKVNSWHFYSEIFNFLFMMKADVDVQPELSTGGNSNVSDFHLWPWCVFFSCNLIMKTFGGAILQSGFSAYLMVVQLKPEAKIHFIISGEYLVIFKCVLDNQILSWRHKWWSK